MDDFCDIISIFYATVLWCQIESTQRYGIIDGCCKGTLRKWTLPLPNVPLCCIIEYCRIFHLNSDPELFWTLTLASYLQAVSSGIVFRTSSMACVSKSCAPFSAWNSPSYCILYWHLPFKLIETRPTVYVRPCSTYQFWSVASNLLQPNAISSKFVSAPIRSW